MDNSELYHWGIKGMKWGVRRYQNKDGSLTPLGKKRAAKLEAQYEKTTGKKMGDSDSSNKPKTIRDMTNEELASATRRNQLEADYIQTSRRLSELSPAPISKGQKFVKGLSDSLTPALQQAGKKLVSDYLEKEGRKLLGLKEDEMKVLQNEVNKLELKVRKRNATEALDDTETKQLKRENEEYAARKQNEAYNEYFSESERAAREQKSRQDAEVAQYKNKASIAISKQTIDKVDQYFDSQIQKSINDLDYNSFKSNRKSDIDLGKETVSDIIDELEK